jgi:uncharacterized membrane protein
MCLLANSATIELVSLFRTLTLDKRAAAAITVVKSATAGDIIIILSCRRPSCRVDFKAISCSKLSQTSSAE